MGSDCSSRVSLVIACFAVLHCRCSWDRSAIRVYVVTWLTSHVGTTARRYVNLDAFVNTFFIIANVSREGSNSTMKVPLYEWPTSRTQQPSSDIGHKARFAQIAKCNARF